MSASPSPFAGAIARAEATLAEYLETTTTGGSSFRPFRLPLRLNGPGGTPIVAFAYAAIQADDGQKFWVTAAFRYPAGDDTLLCVNPTGGQPLWNNAFRFRSNAELEAHLAGA